MITLATTDEVLESFHVAAEGHGMVKVSREALATLLTDHNVMYRALHDKGLIKPPHKPRERARLVAP